MISGPVIFSGGLRLRRGGGTVQCPSVRPCGPSGLVPHLRGCRWGCGGSGARWCAGGLRVRGGVAACAKTLPAPPPCPRLAPCSPPRQSRHGDTSGTSWGHPGDISAPAAPTHRAWPTAGCRHAGDRGLPCERRLGGGVRGRVGFGVCPPLAPGSAVSSPRGAGSRSDRFVGLGGNPSRPRPAGGLGSAATEAKEQTRAACVPPGTEPSSAAGTASCSPARGRGGPEAGRLPEQLGGGKLRQESMVGPHPGDGAAGGGSDGRDISTPGQRLFPCSIPGCAEAGCSPAPGWPGPGPLRPPPWEQPGYEVSSLQGETRAEESWETGFTPPSGAGGRSAAAPVLLPWRRHITPAMVPAAGTALRGASDGLHGAAGAGHRPRRHRLVGLHPLLRLAHVAGDGLRRQQHRGGPDRLGGAVDELRGAEHGADPVQGLRVAAGPAAGPASRPRHGGGGHRLGRAGHPARRRRWQVHQLRGGRHRQSQGHDLLRRHLHRRRCPHPHPRLLVGQHRHPGLLQPAGR